MHPDHDLALAPAVRQLEALAAGEVSSRDLLEVFLARIAEHGPALNAVVTLDVDRARRDAGDADRARAAGEPLGVLHGLPVTVKDSYETAGLRTTCGRRDLADHVPTRDAEAVARLRRAGAVVFGKTNLPPWNADVQADNPIFGRTNNPWDHSRTSGGSAGGGAAATATGLTAFDYGSEIGGSTRIPSHFCGLYGHKTTWRSVPLVGHIGRGPADPGRRAEIDLACAGVQARDARDIAPALHATVGTLPRDGGFTYTLAPPRAGALRDFRVAVWSEDPACPVDSDVRRAIDQAVAAARAAGATVVEHAPLPVDIAESQRAFDPLLYGAPIIERSGIRLAEQAALTLSALRSPRGAAASALRGIFQRHTTWLAADAARHEIRDRWTRFFDDVDVLLLPVTPTAAPPHHGDDLNRYARHIDVDGERRSYWDQMAWNALANVAGAPATTIPVTSTATGLPVGIQAMGAAGDDLTTIEFAALLGAQLQGYRVPPGVTTSSALTG
ncbi:amidase [Actinomycetospora atypica]|uniref:Amidase n=1 Tax=Actinomycetospora atypica TaxID=1290095 RepID=A0ABV9YKD9_9PSEU